MRFLAQTKGRREKERERKRKGKEEEGKEKGKGEREREIGSEALAETEKIAIVVMPFVDGVTQPLQRVLKPLNIRVVGKPVTWKWCLQHLLKDSSNHRHRGEKKVCLHIFFRL